MSASEVPNAAPTGEDAIRSERVGEHLIVIRIDRPHRRNAFDGATARAMEAAIDSYEADDALRCAIITGSDIVFSYGQDLIAAAHGDFGASPKRGGFGIMGVPPNKPLIAAVEGHALAGHLELCLTRLRAPDAFNATPPRWFLNRASHVRIMPGALPKSLV